jgi:hypothetical protein
MTHQPSRCLFRTQIAGLVLRVIADNGERVAAARRVGTFYSLPEP